MGRLCSCEPAWGWSALILRFPTFCLLSKTWEVQRRFPLHSTCYLLTHSHTKSPTLLTAINFTCGIVWSYNVYTMILSIRELEAGHHFQSTPEDHTRTNPRRSRQVSRQRHQPHGSEAPRHGNSTEGSDEPHRRRRRGEGGTGECHGTRGLTGPCSLACALVEVGSEAAGANAELCHSPMDERRPKRMRRRNINKSQESRRRKRRYVYKRTRADLSTPMQPLAR